MPAKVIIWRPSGTSEELVRGWEAQQPARDRGSAWQPQAARDQDVGSWSLSEVGSQVSKHRATQRPHLARHACQGAAGEMQTGRGWRACGSAPPIQRLPVLIARATRCGFFSKAWWPTPTSAGHLQPCQIQQTPAPTRPNLDALRL